MGVIDGGGHAGQVGVQVWWLGRRSRGAAVRECVVGSDVHGLRLVLWRDCRWMVGIGGLGW